MRQISIEDFEQLINKNNNLNILDVRSPQGFENSHIEGAINIPLSKINDCVDQLDKQKEYYIICQIGVSSLKGAQLLEENGFKVTNVESGMSTYSGKTVSNI